MKESLMRARGTILSWIAAAAFVAGPVLAGESTPAEKQQTRQLNTQSLTYAQGVPADQALPASAALPFVDYNAVVRAPAPQGAAQNAPDITASDTLSALSNLPPVIANANVVSSDGKTVGLVQKIQLGANGKPQRLDVALKDNGKTVSFDAHSVSYDAIDNVVIASTSRDEILSMPSTVPQG
jgi:hypothetical protein